MLKSMSMSNLINFRDRQELKFEDGINLMIGANSTGKTACFELLRRCFSDTLNETTSSIPNKKVLAYAVCHFQISENPPIDDMKDVNGLIACLFVKEAIARNSSSVNKSKQYCNIYKVLCTIHEDRTSFAYIKKAQGWHGCRTKDFEDISYHFIELGDNYAPVVKIEAREGPEPEKDLFEKISTPSTPASATSTPASATKMKTIYRWLEDRYVGVMPMRSIGPTQWTRSPNFQSDKNYITACNSAEILNDLLENDKIDKNKEDKYHTNIIFPFEFTKKENEIMVKNTEKDDESFALLKCPEGILEAKQLTLILSHREFSTITLEEPDRGMHPHMIKKLRDLILRNVKEKTVLIITHNPSIINQWTLGRCFVFSKTGENVNISHNIRKFEAKKWSSYNHIEEIKCVLFSPRVLFVEGITDKLVLEAIFSFLTTNANSPIAGKARFKDYLLATEVIELRGATKAEPKKKMCKELMKEAFILYDLDQSKRNNREVHGGKGEFEKADESSRDFYWESGDLEDVILKIKDKLPEEVSTRIAGNDKTEKSEIKKIIKRNIANGRLTDIDVLAETLVINSADVKLFINFLEKMFEKDMPSLSDKRNV